MSSRFDLCSRDFAFEDRNSAVCHLNSYAGCCDIHFEVRSQHAQFILRALDCESLAVGLVCYRNLESAVDQRYDRAIWSHRVVALCSFQDQRARAIIQYRLPHG